MKHAALALFGVLTLCGVPADAHHGYAGFFMDRNVTIQGTLEEVRFLNPHVVLKVRTADSTVHSASFHQGASWFSKRNAFFSQTLKPGDQIVVVASPPRDPASHELVSIKEVRRPRDGWMWQRP